MDLQLKRRVVVITAAGSGIGLACAKFFLGEGAVVVAGDIATAALEALPGEILAVQGDLTKPDAPAALARAAIERFGTIDVLVNNIGGAAVRESFLSVDDDQWNVMFNRNMMAMIRSCRAVLPTMIEKRGGSIVTIASTNSRQPDPFLIDYSAAKAALLSVSKSLSIEYGPLGIRVNCVSPGPTRTPAFMRSIGVIMAAKWGMSSEEALTHYATKVQTMALGRVGDPEDVAPIVGFLASDLARQVTGSEYTVNGGLLKAQ